LNVVSIDGNRMQFKESMNKQWSQHILGAILGICFPVYAASYLFLMGKHKQTIYDKVGNRVVLVNGPPRTGMIVCIATTLLVLTGVSCAIVLDRFKELSSAHAVRQTDSPPKTDTNTLDQKQ